MVPNTSMVLYLLNKKRSLCFTGNREHVDRVFSVRSSVEGTGFETNCYHAMYLSNIHVLAIICLPYCWLSKQEVYHFKRSLHVLIKI